MRYLWLFLLAGCLGHANQPMADVGPVSDAPAPTTGEAPAPDHGSPTLGRDAGRLTWSSFRPFETAAILYEFTPHDQATCTTHLNMTMELQDADPQTWSVSWSGRFTFSSAGTNAPMAHAYAGSVLDLRPQGNGPWVAHTSTLILDNVTEPVRVMRAASHLALAPADIDLRGDGDPTRSIDFSTDCGDQGDMRIEMAEGPIFVAVHNTNGTVGAGVRDAGIAVAGTHSCSCPGQGRAFVGQHGTASVGTIEVRGEQTWKWEATSSEMVTAYDGGRGPFTASIDVATEGGVYMVAGGFDAIELETP